MKRSAILGLSIGLPVAVVLCVALAVILYFVLRKKGGQNGGGAGGSGAMDGMVGVWVNSTGTQGVGTACDMVMLASYNPNPFISCTDVFTMNPSDFSAIKGLVTQYRQQSQAKYVLLSVGGSSFGMPDWQALLYPYTKVLPDGLSSGECNCAAPGYWFGCTNQPAPVGDTGVIFDASSTSVSDYTKCPLAPGSETVRMCGDPASGCCKDASNPHLCYCSLENNELVHTADGRYFCQAKKASSACEWVGMDMAKYNQCTGALAPPKDPVAMAKCALNNGDVVKAYVNALVQTGADGIDFDFENPDPKGTLSAAIINFAKDLRVAYKAATGKDIVMNITVLSGDAYGTMYGPLYTSLKSSTCPFDYVIPMLYGGFQYPYSVDRGGFSAKGLIDLWETQFLTAQSNVKLIPAFILYAATEDQWTQADNEAFLSDTVKQTTKPKAQGAAYFYYSSDYDVPAMNERVQAAMKVF